MVQMENVADQHGCILAASHHSTTGTTNYSFDYFIATINNCHTSATNSTLINGVNSAELSGSNSGGICGKALGRENSTGTITNCTNYIPISGSNAGGICGGYFRGSVSGCNNYGVISGNQAGGICGQYAGKDQSLEIINCDNFGVISGNQAGGICGQYAGYKGTLTVELCTNEANITGEKCGGICGYGVGWGDSQGGGTITIEDCTNEADIEGENSGGICGPTKYVTLITITSCSNTGQISSEDGGGIFASNFANTGTGVMTNCYNTGEINGVKAGGICGQSTGKNGTVTISYCWNEADISSNQSGGIVGAYAGYSSGTVNIEYCYNVGNIVGENSGGLCGNYTGQDSGSVTIFNCYNDANGTNGVDYQGGIIGGQETGKDSGTVNVYNCWSKGTYLNRGIVSGKSSSASKVIVRNCYYIGDSNTTKATNSSNNKKTDTDWDDTYAYYTIGQIGRVTEFIEDDIRWYNNRNSSTDKWLIGETSSEMGDGSGFKTQVTLGTNNQGTKPASMSDLLVIFSGAITENNGTYTLGADITIDNNNKDYFPISIEDGVTFDGGYDSTATDPITITIDYLGRDGSGNEIGWEGLFKAVQGYTFTVKNVKFDLYGSDLAENAGCITSKNHDGSWLISNCSWNIDNCYSTSTNSKKIKSNGAGICGMGIGYNGGAVSVTNCINDLSSSDEVDGNGDYIHIQCAGIVARNGGQEASDDTSNGSSLVVSGCTNNGSFPGEKSGGICGHACFKRNSNTNNAVRDCTNNGEISGYYSGGICGSNIAQNGGSVEISSCINTGAISGQRAGGICGRYVAYSSGEVQIDSCPNSGTISGSHSGGICGEYADNYEITYCSNSGNIDADYAGGICGGRAYSGTIQYCWNTGDIGNSSNSNGGSGGICGLRAADVTNTTLVISYCYNNGVITSKNSGGICGLYAGSDGGTLTVFNCYNYADGTGLANQGGILGNGVGNGTTGGTANVYNCWSKGDNLSDGITSYISNNATLNIENCYSIISGINISRGSGATLSKTNTYEASSWSHKEAYETIGQGTVSGYTDIRWYNTDSYESDYQQISLSNQTTFSEWVIGDTNGLDPGICLTAGLGTINDSYCHTTFPDRTDADDCNTDWLGRCEWRYE